MLLIRKFNRLLWIFIQFFQYLISVMIIRFLPDRLTNLIMTISSLIRRIGRLIWAMSMTLLHALCDLIEDHVIPNLIFLFALFLTHLVPKVPFLYTVGLCCTLSFLEIVNGVKRLFTYKTDIPENQPPKFIRTPDQNVSLSPDLGYFFKPRYLEFDGGRVHYVDVGNRDASRTVLMVHGFGSWSFAFR